MLSWLLRASHPPPPPPHPPVVSFAPSPPPLQLTTSIITPSANSSTSADGLCTAGMRAALANTRLCAAILIARSAALPAVSRHRHRWHRRRLLLSRWHHRKAAHDTVWQSAVPERRRCRVHYQQAKASGKASHHCRNKGGPLAGYCATGMQGTGEFSSLCCHPRCKICGEVGCARGVGPGYCCKGGIVNRRRANKLGRGAEVCRDESDHACVLDTASISRMRILRECTTKVITWGLYARNCEEVDAAAACIGCGGPSTLAWR